MKRFSFLGVLAFLFLSCSLFDSGTDIVIDDYEVAWIDLHENRALYKHQVLIIPAYIFAARHDSKFIFAKQYPVLNSSKEHIDKAVAYYYIIERTKNDFQDRPVYGPLTKQGFEEKCFDLGIKNPQFDLSYRTNF